MNIFDTAFSNTDNTPKYRQIVDAVTNAISDGRLKVGDSLPSINQMIQEYHLSRDTVFKAYRLLKEQDAISSTPNKGYFIKNPVNKVFVFFDTFKAYKEVLYESLIRNMPENVIVDVNFHHYNPVIFKKLIDDSIGKYSKYIVMPFDHPSVERALRLIPKDRLLIADRKMFDTEGSNVLYQDFSEPLSHGLENVLHLLRKYREVHFIYPDYTNHPYESVECFKAFCERNNLTWAIETDPTQFEVRAGIAYLSVSDRMLAEFLEQCRLKKLEPGVDTGIISYNDTPMKKFIYKGITTFSTDFRFMGRKAAEFISSDAPMNLCVPSEMIIRESL